MDSFIEFHCPLKMQNSKDGNMPATTCYRLMRIQFILIGKHQKNKIEMKI